MKTTTVSLAKCLKLKNRIAGRLLKVQQEIQNNNSVLKEHRHFVDVGELEIKYLTLSRFLKEIKVAIAKANANCCETLIELAELKVAAKFYASISTREGTFKGYDNEVEVYEVFYDKKKIDSNVEAIQKRIDALQDELDIFNHKTTVDISAEILDLV